MKALLLAALTTLLLATSAPFAAHAATPEDRAALQGVKSGKGIFDINITDVEKLPLYLQVIKETNDGLKKQGVKPDLIVVFQGRRGPFCLQQPCGIQPGTEGEPGKCRCIASGIGEAGGAFRGLCRCHPSVQGG